MFIRRKSSANSPRKTIQIVENIRIGKTTRQTILAYIGVVERQEDEEKIMALAQLKMTELIKEKRANQGQTLTDEEATSLAKPGRKKKTLAPPIKESSIILANSLVEECRILDGLHEIAGQVFEQLGLSKLMRTAKQNRLLKDVVLMRMLYGHSKHRLCDTIQNKLNQSYNVDQIYRLMDNLHPIIERIKRKIFERTHQLMPSTNVLLFDVTTLYCESVSPDELRQFGFSKDGKFNNTQLVLALATNEAGLPIGYEVFPGNFAEVHTLLEAIKKWNQTLSIDNVCFIGDRAMFSENNIRLIEAHGYQYIIAAKLRGQSDSLKEKILNNQNYQWIQWDNETGRIAEFELPQRDTLRCGINTELLGYSLLEKDNILIALQYYSPKKGKKQVTLKNLPQVHGDIQALKCYTRACPCVFLTSEEHQVNPSIFHEMVIVMEDRIIFQEATILFSTLDDKENIRLYQHIKKGKIPGSLMKKLWPSYQGKRYKNIPHSLIEQCFPDYERPKRRLCVSYKLSRAERDAQQRERILSRLQDREGKVNKILRTTAKMFMSAEGQASLDHAKIAEAEKWDGLHGIITNITEETPQNLLSRYNQLWRIEEAFRINKHNLSMRPIYHFKPERIQSHLVICYIAFAILKLIQYQTQLTQPRLTIQKILTTLLSIESSIYVDITTSNRYKIPGHMSADAKALYQAFGIKRYEKIIPA